MFCYERGERGEVEIKLGESKLVAWQQFPFPLTVRYVM